MPHGAAAEPDEPTESANVSSPATPAHEDGSEPVRLTIAPRPEQRRGSKRWRWVVLAGLVLAAVGAASPRLLQSLRLVSTDDAYVNGHVTFVAARVPGKIVQVLVDDNNRVHKGQPLVRLDAEPYQVQVSIARAAVVAAEADLVTAQAQVRGLEGQTRSLRFALERAIEDVDNRVALLRSKVATLASEKAVLARAQVDYDRVLPLLAPEIGGVTQEEVEHRKQTLLGAQAQVEAALQDVNQIRAGLGLPAKPATSDDLAQVPPDLDQTFSAVRQAQASLMQAAAQLGVTASFNQTPREMIAEFYKRDPQGDIDRIYAQLLKDAPAVKQAQSRLTAARRALDQAELNVRYCEVVADIDGVVTRRVANPGNNVLAGQSLMAVRSLTDIWVDANFKETQLATLRIGQPVDLDVDMYGRRHHFTGRVSGFTNGTGSTLALLPPENATGNFVKVVQRLPVRIEFQGYDPDQTPLFVGLSVTARVHVDAAPSGPDAGKILQPAMVEPPLSAAIPPPARP